MDLLAAEMMARTGRDPSELYRELTGELGEPRYARVDAPATPDQKQRLSKLSADQVRAATLAGHAGRLPPVHAVLLSVCRASARHPDVSRYSGAPFTTNSVEG